MNLSLSERPRSRHLAEADHNLSGSGTAQIKRLAAQLATDISNSSALEIKQGPTFQGIELGCKEYADGAYRI
jgi:hypothetical protein